jgi:hypothetical protein
MGFVILWICCGIVGVLIARGKGNNELGGGCLGFLLGPIGLLIVFFQSDSSQVHKFKEHVELGKKAEFRKLYEDAKNHYMDAIYHLEKDYKNQSQSEDLSRKFKIIDLYKKIDELNSKV